MNVEYTFKYVAVTHVTLKRHANFTLLDIASIYLTVNTDSKVSEC